MNAIDAVLTFHTNLGDMTPGATSDDLPHSIKCDPMFQCESLYRFSVRVCGPDSANVGIGKAGIVIGDAPSPSPFLKCIAHIVCVRPSEQMRGPDAVPCVAVVADADVWCQQQAIRTFPCDSMHQCHAAVGPSDNPIAVAVDVSHPQPTFAVFVNVSPEAFEDCAVFVSHD